MDHMNYTNKEQSKLLLEYGVSLGSADMCYQGDSEIPVIKVPEGDELPCWSIGALGKLIPEHSIERSPGKTRIISKYSVVVEAEDECDAFILAVKALSERGYIIKDRIQYIDLGLSVKWADRNLGALEVKDYGYRFPHSEMLGVDYARVPGRKELLELVKECTWAWDTKRSGFLVTGKNGNSVFFPATGELNDDGLKEVGKASSLWSSSMAAGDKGWAWYMSFIRNKPIYGKDKTPKSGVYQTHISWRTLNIRTVL